MFCCKCGKEIPDEIPAIIFSAQVNGKLEAGDYRGAVESSKKAKKFSWIAFGVGPLITIIHLHNQRVHQRNGFRNVIINLQGIRWLDKP